MIFFVAFLVSFVYVFLKAFQQLNVVHGEYKLMLPISYLLALCEVFTIGAIVATSPWIFLSIGTGGGLGCMLSCYTHGVMQKRREA